MKRVSVVVVGLLVMVGGACGAEDGSGGRPDLPWSAAAAAASAAADSAGGAAPMAQESSAVARDLSMPYLATTYELADGLDADKSSAAAYRVDADGTDEDDVARLAKALGVSGEVEDHDGEFVVSDDDRRLSVTQFGGGASWNVGSEGGGDETVASVSAVCSPDGECKEVETVAPKPLTDLPPKEDVRGIAEAFASAADLGDVEFGEVDGEPSYGWTIQITRLLGGVRVYGFESYLTIGSGGTIVGGGGTLADPEKVGDYPLVSAAEAFERYNDGSFGGGVGIARPAMGAPEPAPMVEGGPTVDADSDEAKAREAEAGTTSGSGSVEGSPGSRGSADPAPPSEEIAPDPGMPEPMPVPVPEDTLPPEVVELDSVRLVLTPAYQLCPGDPLYLVPAFEFSKGDEHVVGPAVAVEDDDLASTGASADADADGSVSSEESPCPAPDGKEPDAPTPVDGGGTSGSTGSGGSSSGGGSSGATEPAEPTEPAESPTAPPDYEGRPTP